MPAISDLFAQFGDPARVKLLTVGPDLFSSEMAMSQPCSLNFEHVSLAGLLRPEISRRTSLGVAAERAHRTGQSLPEETIFAVFRRWFWTRKPDAGFVLQGFPATLLQAKVFDEWLDARNEDLDGILVSGLHSAEPVIAHYRTCGLTIVESAALSV